MIRVENLRKHYTVHEKEPGLAGSLRAFVRRKTKIVHAVNDISFELTDGEMVGFLGPNGAGKTTTLKMLAGILHPSSGLITIDGFTPIERRSAFLKQITLVMGQKQQLFWDLPALDSFRVNQAIYEVPQPVYQAVLSELTEILDLKGVLNKQVRQLSLGERMKCELVAAMLHQPKILFLDEPTIGLDVNMQTQVRDFIAEYNRRFNATVILTSHYMADVLALCKRVIVIDQGRIIFDGDLSSLIARVATNKIIRLEFASPVPAEQLKQYGEVDGQELLRAKIRVPRSETSHIATRLLAELPITDVSIEDPPIEDVIRSVFATKGQLDVPAQTPEIVA